MLEYSVQKEPPRRGANVLDLIGGRYNLDLQGLESASVVVPPITEVGVRDMCPSSGSASPKATVAMRQMTSIVEGADLRVGRSGV